MIIARKKTADGKSIQLHDDGLVTGAFGFKLKGIGKSRSPEGRELDRQAGWIVMGDAGLYTLAEMPRVVKAARFAVRRQQVRAGFERPLPVFRRLAATLLKTASTGGIAGPAKAVTVRPALGPSRLGAALGRHRWPSRIPWKVRATDARGKSADKEWMAPLGLQDVVVSASTRDASMSPRGKYKVWYVTHRAAPGVHRAQPVLTSGFGADNLREIRKFLEDLVALRRGQRSAGRRVKVRPRSAYMVPRHTDTFLDGVVLPGAQEQRWLDVQQAKIYVDYLDGPQEFYADARTARKLRKEAEIWARQFSTSADRAKAAALAKMLKDQGA